MDINKGRGLLKSVFIKKNIVTQFCIAIFHQKFVKSDKQKHSQFSPNKCYRNPLFGQNGMGGPQLDHKKVLKLYF